MKKDEDCLEDEKVEEESEMEIQEEPYKNAKEKLYDKIPLNFKQVDIITKVLIAITIGLFIFFVIKSNM